MLLSTHMTSVLFLVWLNNFALTMAFCWSYTLLLKLPVVMLSCFMYTYRFDRKNNPHPWLNVKANQQTKVGVA